MRIPKIFKTFNLFSVIIILGLISLIPAFSNFQDLAQKNREIKLKMKQLTSENRILLEKQNRLQNDPIFAESVARKELNVAKEGEVVFKILPEE